MPSVGVYCLSTVQHPPVLQQIIVVQRSKSEVRTVHLQSNVVSHLNILQSSFCDTKLNLTSNILQNIKSGFY